MEPCATTTIPQASRILHGSTISIKNISIIKNQPISDILKQDESMRISRAAENKNYHRIFMDSILPMGNSMELNIEQISPI
mgnify:CR=1 FL=1